jgi:hypothetical protein
MLRVMQEMLKSILDAASALRTQLHAALLIPLSDATLLDESDEMANDSMEERDAPASGGKSFKCVDDRPGYLTSNGVGSLEIGAAHDD